MNRFFLEALDIRGHPMKRAKRKTQAEYITALTYIIKKSISETKYNQTEIKKYVNERLRLYQNQLFADIPITNGNEKYKISCLSAFSKPWLRKYCYILVCDVALILLKEPLILSAVMMIKEQLPTKQQADVEHIFSLLQNNQEVQEKYIPAYPLIKQYRANKDFFSESERRIIVTANTSAGKSTLINAIVGKPIARTSQEVCTGNVCYLFNKAYEDENTCVSAQNLNLSASADDLHSLNWDAPVFIASYFAGITTDVPRLCLVDTPGVDSARYNREHSKCTHDALLNDNYDIIIYVVSPTRLGTDAEKKHLRWVARHLQKDKIIFVLNKIDDYHDLSDSIEDSVRGFKEDLLKIGFENPVICPISAYFSYLLKLKITGQTFSEDEADEYALYSRKFMRSTYDVSHYYDGVQCFPTDSEEIALSKRVGLYGLEKIIYGGRL